MIYFIEHLRDFGWEILDDAEGRDAAIATRDRYTALDSRFTVRMRAQS